MDIDDYKQIEEEKKAKTAESKKRKTVYANFSPEKKAKHLEWEKIKYAFKTGKMTQEEFDKLAAERKRIDYSHIPPNVPVSIPNSPDIPERCGKFAPKADKNEIILNLLNIIRDLL